MMEDGFLPDAARGHQQSNRCPYAIWHERTKTPARSGHGALMLSWKALSEMATRVRILLGAPNLRVKSKNSACRLVEKAAMRPMVSMRNLRRSRGAAQSVALNVPSVVS